jgi:hypothetical protein
MSSTCQVSATLPSAMQSMFMYAEPSEKARLSGDIPRVASQVVRPVVTHQRMPRVRGRTSADFVRSVARAAGRGAGGTG